MARIVLLLTLLLAPGCAEPARDGPAPGDGGGDRGSPPEIKPKRIEMH